MWLLKPSNAPGTCSVARLILPRNLWNRFHRLWNNLPKATQQYMDFSHGIYTRDILAFQCPPPHFLSVIFPASICYITEGSLEKVTSALRGPLVRWLPRKHREVGRWKRKHMSFSEEVMEGFREEAVFWWLLRRKRSSAGGLGRDRRAGVWQKRPSPGTPAPLAVFLLYSEVLWSLCLECPLSTGSFCLTGSLCPPYSRTTSRWSMSQSSFSDRFTWPIRCF